MRKKLYYTNRGILLLLIALISVTVYLVYDFIRSNSEAKKIRSQVESFISDSSQAFSFPKEKLSELEDATETHAFLMECSKTSAATLSSYYLDNEALREELYESISGVFELEYSQYKNIASQVTRSCSDIKVKVYKDTATVETKVTNYFVGEGLEIPSFSAFDSFEFIYQDGSWQCVGYYPSINSYMY